MISRRRSTLHCSDAAFYVSKHVVGYPKENRVRLAVSLPKSTQLFIGEQKAKDGTLATMKLARVSFTDMDRIEHAVTVEARSMFHAVGLAIVRFRNYGVGDPGPLTRFTVEAREPATEHTVTQKQFEEWLERTGGSPADVAQGSDLKALLKETEPPDLARARKPRFH